MRGSSHLLRYGIAQRVGFGVVVIIALWLVLLSVIG